MSEKEIFGCTAFGLGDQVFQVEGEASSQSFYLADAVLPVNPSGRILTGDIAENERIHSGLYWPPEARVQQGKPLRRAPIPCVWYGLVEAGDQLVRWHVGRGVSFTLSRILSTHVVDLLKQSGCRPQDMAVLAIPDALDEFGQDALLRDFKFSGFENIQLLWRPVASALSWLSELDQNNAFDTSTDDMEHIIVVYIGPDGVEMNTFMLRRQEFDNVTFVIPVRERPQHISTVVGFDWAANTLDAAYPDIDDGAFWQAFTDFPHVWEAMSERQFSSDLEEWSFKDRWTFWKPDTNLRNCAHQLSTSPNTRLRKLLEYSCGLFKINVREEDSPNDESLTNLFAKVLESKRQSHLRGVIVAGPLCPSTLPAWIQTAEEGLRAQGINGISTSPQLDMIWLAHEKDAILDGCAEYGRRLDMGLPTYLDTLPQLAMLVEQRGEHVWEALLSAETCEGGKPYKPTTIQGKFGIQAGAQNLQVYLKKGGIRRRANLETAIELKDDKTSLSKEKCIEIDNKIQRAGTYEDVLKFVANGNNDLSSYSKKRARELFGNPFRKAIFAFPSVPDKKMPVDISVEIRPASGLAQITLVPSNPEDCFFLKGRQIFLDYSTMEEADPPPPPTLGWPTVVKIKVDPTASFLKFSRWKINQYLQTPPDNPQFINMVEGVSKVLFGSSWIDGDLGYVKSIDQDGMAGTDKGSQKIDAIASKVERDFSYVQSDNKRKFITKMTWLFGKTPENMKQGIYEYITGPYGNNWNWMIEAAGRSFTTGEDYQLLYYRILKRINSNQNNTFPICCSNALWRVLSMRENSPMHFTRLQAKTFTEEAVKKMEQEAGVGNYQNKFFKAARLFLFLLRFRVVDQDFLDPDKPLDSDLFERTIHCLRSAENYFSRSNDNIALRAKELVIGIEKFMRYEGNNEILIELDRFVEDSH